LPLTGLMARLTRVLLPEPTAQRHARTAAHGRVGRDNGAAGDGTLLDRIP
jgi:hypothetical protein